MSFRLSALSRHVIPSGAEESGLRGEEPGCSAERLFRFFDKLRMTWNAANPYNWANIQGRSKARD